jgi:hypothetical protein
MGEWLARRFGVDGNYICGLLREGVRGQQNAEEKQAEGNMPSHGHDSRVVSHVLQQPNLSNDEVSAAERAGAAAVNSLVADRKSFPAKLTYVVNLF